MGFDGPSCAERADMECGIGFEPRPNTMCHVHLDVFGHSHALHRSEMEEVASVRGSQVLDPQNMLDA